MMNESKARAGPGRFAQHYIRALIVNNYMNWTNWTNAVLGLVLIGMAFYGSVDTNYAWAFGILGAVIAVVGFWGGAAQQQGGSVIKHA